MSDSKQMTPDEYQRLAARTECDQSNSKMRMSGAASMKGLPRDVGVMLLPVRLNHGVLGLTGEVGELAGALEKWLYYGRDLDLTNVTEEVGDCLWYLALLCNALGLSLASVMEANVAKLKARFPDKYTDAHAANRDVAAERRIVEERARPSPAPTTMVVQDGHGFGHVEEVPGTTLPDQPTIQPAPVKKQLKDMTVEEVLADYEVHGNPLHPSHDWHRRMPSDINLRCRKCGAYSQLGSGFLSCSGNPTWRGQEPPVLPGTAEQPAQVERLPMSPEELALNVACATNNAIEQLRRLEADAALRDLEGEE